MTNNITRLGARQIDVAEWAICPMHDHWVDEISETFRSEGYCYRDHDMPRVEGSTLVLEHCADELIADLLYRLGDQLPSMAFGSADPKLVADARAGERLADRISNACAVNEERQR